MANPYRFIDRVSVTHENDQSTWSSTSVHVLIRGMTDAESIVLKQGIEEVAKRILKGT